MVSPGALRIAGQLLHRRGRARQKAFLAEGPQAVREALDSPGAVKHLIVDEASSAHPLIERARQSGVAVMTATADQMGQLCQTVHAQGLVAVCQVPAARLDDLGTPRLVVVANEVRDPGNLGVLIRNADAFGADAVVLTPGCVDVWNPKVVRATTGSLFHLPLADGVPLVEATVWARAQGMRLVAADAEGSALEAFAAAGGLDHPVAWVFGNEAWGFTQADLALADDVVSVPMWGRAESLNVGSASAVCLFVTASRQRRGGAAPSVGRASQGR